MPTRLWYDLVVGLLTSFIAGGITAYFLFLKERILNKRKYGQLIGFYHGFTVHKTESSIRIDQPKSHATVTYVKGNRLRIEVTDQPYTGHNKWIGDIAMNSGSEGVLTWRYLKHENIEQDSIFHLFGIKDLVRQEIGDDLFIFLVDREFRLADGSLAKEVFRKVH